MSFPVEGGGSGEGRLADHRLRLARIRAETTGESVAHALSVFRGTGILGEADEPGEDGGPAEDGTYGRSGTCGGHGGSAAHGEDHERPGDRAHEAPGSGPALAPVIPLSRAARRSAARE